MYYTSASILAASANYAKTWTTDLCRHKLSHCRPGQALYGAASRFRHQTFIDNQHINPYPTAFPYGNGMVLHFYQQQESSTTKTVHKVINKGLKTYV